MTEQSPGTPSGGLEAVETAVPGRRKDESEILARACGVSQVRSGSKAPYLVELRVRHTYIYGSIKTYKTSTLIPSMVRTQISHDVVDWGLKVLGGVRLVS